MHSHLLLSLCVTLLALSGCTKSPVTDADSQPRGSASGTPPKQLNEADTRPVIVAFGDSLSEGLGVDAGGSFPDQLQRMLDKNGYKYRVVNMGVSGDTTTGGLGRVAYALSIKPAVVILELGGNDGLRGVPVSSTKANLEKMIVQFQQSGAQVLLAGMTLPPNYGPEYIRSFEGAYRELAAKYKLQLIPFLMQDIATQLQSQPGLMQRDGIHPTAAGHAVIAETVFRFLRPMIQRS
ncbi:MAG TPA: arylesterase [Bryobacteraceae bacterium]|nr:arylesterase [Bryobacteraceae bacterium]